MICSDNSHVLFVLLVIYLFLPPLAPVFFFKTANVLLTCSKYNLYIFLNVVSMLLM